MLSENHFYTDIHSHFIFGVDDGAPDEKQTLLMLRQAEQLNIRHLMATPHALEMMNEEQSKILLERFSGVQRLINENNIGLEIKLGAELYFNPLIYHWLKYPWATFNNQQKYLLFELPFFELPPGVGDFIFQCRLKGLIPILAHPERYSYLRGGAVDILVAWHQQGCLMQMNAGSVTGQFGQKISAFSRTLLKAGLIHFVASDAHDPEYRNYKVLVNAEETGSEFLAQDYINELFRENPAKVFDNLEVESRSIDISDIQTKTDKVISFFRKSFGKVKY